MASVRNLFLGGILAFGVACGDESTETTGDSVEDGGTPGDADAGSTDDGADDGGRDEHADAGAKAGKYVLSVIVFGPDDSTNTYVSLVDSLDTKAIDVKGGIEFGGQANIAAYGGKLYISDGEEPTITRYHVTAANKLEEEAKVSFAKFGEGSVSVDDTANTFISATKAYLSGPDGSLVVWNPSTMKLTGEIPVKAPIKDMGEDYSLNTTSGLARGNRLYRTFSWINWLTYEFAADQYFAVYDTDKDELLSVVTEDRCPALGAQATVDATGTAYFSNWFYNLAGILQNGKPSACALRLKPGSDTLDASWKLDFTELTGGHEGAQLTSIGNDRAVFAAFHEEDIEISPEDSPYDIVASEHWETWSLDLATEEAQPVTGIGRLGAQQTVFTLDGRTFLFAPNQDFDTTKVYEVLANGESRLAFTLDGWSRAFLKLE